MTPVPQSSHVRVDRARILGSCMIVLGVSMSMDVVRVRRFTVSVTRAHRNVPRHAVGRIVGRALRNHVRLRKGPVTISVIRWKILVATSRGIV